MRLRKVFYWSLQKNWRKNIMANPCSGCKILGCNLGKYPGCLTDTRYPALLEKSEIIRGKQTGGNSSVVVCEEPDEVKNKKVWPIRQKRGKNPCIVVTTKRNAKPVVVSKIIPFAAVKNPYAITYRSNYLALRRCV